MTKEVLEKLNKSVDVTFVKTFELKKAEDSEDIYEIEGIATEEGSYDKGDEVFEAGCFDDEIGKTIFYTEEECWKVYNEKYSDENKKIYEELRRLRFLQEKSTALM